MPGLLQDNEAVLQAEMYMQHLLPKCSFLKDDLWTISKAVEVQADEPEALTSAADQAARGNAEYVRLSHDLKRLASRNAGKCRGPHLFPRWYPRRHLV